MSEMFNSAWSAFTETKPGLHIGLGLIMTLAAFGLAFLNHKTEDGHSKKTWIIAVLLWIGGALLIISGMGKMTLTSPASAAPKNGQGVRAAPTRPN